MFKEKAAGSPWSAIRDDLLRENYDVTTKCLHNKFHRKSRGKESAILALYRKRISNNDSEKSQQERRISSKDNDSKIGADSNESIGETSPPEPDNFPVGSDSEHENSAKFHNEAKLTVVSDLDGLHRMKFIDFRASIHSICPLPFQVFYYNPEQAFL